MYCNKCGNPINAEENFCSVCGKNIRVSFSSNQKKLLEYSKYLMIITAPLMLILRMLTQEEGTDFGWSGEYTYYTVPGNYRVIMAVIAVGLLGTSLYLKNKSGLKSKFVVIGCIVSAIVSCMITFID